MPNITGRWKDGGLFSAEGVPIDTALFASIQETHMQAARQLHRIFASLMLLACAATAAAAGPTVTASGSTAQPGGQAQLALTIDFGESFELIAQDLLFQYDAGVLDFSAANSSVQFGNVSQSWTAYVSQLSNEGVVVENFNAPANTPGRTGYVLSFVGDQQRAGLMQMSLAFDVLQGASPGPSMVTFAGSTMANALEQEFPFPVALSSPGVAINVTPVPEPTQSLLFLAGLGTFAAWRWRRTRRQA